MLCVCVCVRARAVRVCARVSSRGLGKHAAAQQPCTPPAGMLTPCLTRLRAPPRPPCPALQGLPPRNPDKSRVRFIDHAPEDAKNDVDFQRMVQDVSGA